MSGLLIRKEKIIRIVVIAIAIVGFLCSSVSMGYVQYSVGTMFLHFIFISMVFFGSFYGKIENKFWKKIMDISLIVYVVGLLYSVICVSLIFSGENDSEIPEDTTLVVLGCSVKGETPSLSFKQRLDTAYDYLVENPRVYVIVAGGQGSDEIIPEGECGKNYLIEKGIDENRIFAEIKSTSTWENLSYSLDIIKEKNLSQKVTIVTQGYHQYRAGLQADELDIENYSIAAPLESYLIPSSYGREILALTKYYILSIGRML